MRMIKEPQVRFAALVLAAVLALAGCDERAQYGVADYLRDAERAMQERRPADAIVHYKNAVQLAPEDAALRMHLVRAYFAFGDVESAASEVRKVRKLGRTDPETGMLFIEAQLLMRNVAAAQEFIATLEDEEREDPKLAVAIVWAQVAAGDVESARPELETLLTSTDRDVLGLAHLAAAELAQVDGDHDTMMAHLGQVNVEHVAYPYAQTLLGDEWVRRGDFEQAQGAYEKAIDRWPHYLPPLFGIAQAALQLQQFDETERHLERLRGVRAKSVEANYLAGLLALVREEPPATVISFMREALALQPGLAEAILVLSDALIRSEQYEQAIEHLQRYVGLRPNDDASRKRLAALLLWAGQPATAKAQLLALSAHSLAQDDAQLMLATAAARQGDAAEALAYLQALEGQPAEQATIEVARHLLAAGDFEQAYAALDGLNTTKSTPRLLIDDLTLQSAAGSARLGDALRRAEDRLVQAPDDPAALVHAADANRIGGDLDRAAALYARVKGGPELETRALLGLARIDLAQQDFAAAEQRLEQARVLAPANEDVHLLRGELESARGAHDQAIAVLEEGLEQTSPGLELRVALARQLVAMGRFDEALQRVEEVRLQQPAHREAGILWADLQVRKQDVHAAIRHYEAMLAENPGDWALRKRLFKLQLRSGQQADAERTLARLKAGTTQGANMAALEVEWYLASNALAEASRVLEAALAKWPDNAALHVLDGDLEYAEQAYEAAIASYRAAFELDPTARTVQKIAGAHRAAGDRGATLATLEAWLAEHPDDAFSRALVGVTYRELGQPEDALREFESLYAAGYRNAFVAVSLAELLEASDPARALDYALQATRVDSKNTRALGQVGRLYLEAGKLDEGLSYLRRAAEAEQGEASFSARFELAEALAAASRYGEARRVVDDMLAQRDLPERAHAWAARFAEELKVQASATR